MVYFASSSKTNRNRKAPRWSGTGSAGRVVPETQADGVGRGRVRHPPEDLDAEIDRGVHRHGHVAGGRLEQVQRRLAGDGPGPERGERPAQERQELVRSEEKEQDEGG